MSNHYCETTLAGVTYQWTFLHTNPMNIFRLYLTGFL